MKRTKDELAELVKKYFVASENAKRQYEKADAILDEIAKQVEPGEMIKLSARRRAYLEDRWKDQSKVFAGGYHRRYKIEVIES